MSSTNNQNSQEKPSQNKANFVPDAMQGTEDTQSEFSVDEMRAERREEGARIDEQGDAAPSEGDDSAVTQSEFSADKRLRGDAQ